MDETQRMWEDRYAAGQGSPDGAQPHPEVAALLGRHPAGRTGHPPTALDLGSGAGRHTLALARAGYDTTGVDFSPSAVRTVHGALARDGLGGRAVLADLRSWTPQQARERGEDVPAEFDLIVGVYFQQDLTLLRRAAEWLAPGGTLLWISHAPDSVDGPPPHVARPELLETIAVLEGKDLDFQRGEEQQTSGTALDVVVEAVRPGGP